MNIKKYKYYVAIPVIYILYSAVHTLIIVTSGKYAGLKPGFGIFEKKFLVFFIGSAVCYFVEKFCQFAVIEAIFSLFLYQCPDFQFGHAFFILEGENWFTAPQTVVQNLYASRFGGVPSTF